jgi:hypothetical protein
MRLAIVSRAAVLLAYLAGVLLHGRDGRLVGTVAAAAFLVWAAALLRHAVCGQAGARPRSARAGSAIDAPRVIG